MRGLQTLETFVAIATLGSFRAAASKLNATQPALSQRIAQLEGDLGVALFDRGGRGIRLTEKGSELLAYAEQMLALASEMRLKIGAQDAVRGTVRLGVAETIVHAWLARFVEVAATAYPSLALEIEVDTSPHLRTSLMAQEIDLAFMLGPLGEPGLRSRPLCRFPVAFLASPRLPLPAAPVPLSRLAAHPLITFARRTQPHAAVRELFARPGLPPIRLHASASLAPVVRLAVDGFGVAVIPPAVAQAELSDGRLRIVPTTVELPELAFHAVWRTGGSGPAELLVPLAEQVAMRTDGTHLS